MFQARISGMIIPEEMHEQRRGEEEAVDPVEDAAVSGQEASAVFEAEVAFEGGEGDVSQEPESAETCRTTPSR